MGIQEYVRKRLDEVVGQHHRISRESGVPQATVSRIHTGVVSPRLSTVQPILDWFAKEDALAAKMAGVKNRPAQILDLTKAE